MRQVLKFLKQVLLTFRLRLILLVLICVGPSFLISFYLLFQIQKKAIDEIKIDALNLAKIVAFNLDDHLSEMRGILALLSTQIHLEKDSPKNIHETLIQLLHFYPAYSNIRILKPDGSILASAVTPFDPGKVNFSNSSWFREAEQTGQFTVGKYEIGEITGIPGVSIALPVLGNDLQVQAVISASIQLEHFKSIFNFTKYPLGTTLFLFDRDGALLFRNPQGKGSIGKKLPKKSVLSQIQKMMGEGNLDGVGVDEKKHIFGYDTVGPVDHPYFSIGIAFPIAAALSEELQIFRNGIILFLILTFLAFVAASFFGEILIERPVQNVVRVCQQIKEGHLHARNGPPYQGGELGLLARSLDEMTNSLVHREKELEKALDTLKTAQKKMIEQERFEALGKMASGIAHDFNNSLTTILGFIDLLLDYPQTLENKEETLRHLETIRGAAKDAAKIVTRLREFYRPTQEQLAPVNLNQLIEHTVQLTRPKWKDEPLKKGITNQVTTRLKGIPPILGDEGDLREALMNLIFNAVDAMPKGGLLTLETEVKNSEVIVKVTDTGTGMSPETLLHAFEPFFTTKGEKGTGLGLINVYGTMKRHQGFVQIKTAEGKGTTFILRFPAMTTGKIPQTIQVAQKTVLSPLNILLVDDDPEVLTILPLLLKKEGHRVTAVSSPETALETFKKEAFDLAILDVVMPKMTGYQLAENLKGINSKLPVILITGFSDLIQPTNPFANYVLPKPVTGEEIKTVLNKLFLAA